MLNGLLYKLFKLLKPRKIDKDLSAQMKGIYAKQLKDNPLFQLIIEEIEDEITEAWKMSPARDKEGREFLYLRIEAIRKIEAMIEKYINDALFEQIKGQGESQPEQEE